MSERGRADLAGKYLRPIIDGYYDRECLLVNKGLNSFTPPLRFEEWFCETEEELKEQRAFIASRMKEQVFPCEKSLRAFLELRESRAEISQKTGNPWDSQLTVFRRRILKIQAQEAKRFSHMLAPYKRNVEELWGAEVEVFSNEAYLGFDESKKTSRRNLYKLVMKDRATSSGFDLDRGLSTATKPVFSKSILGLWKVCFLLDNVQLNKPVEGEMKNMNTGEVYQTGPYFDLRIGLAECSDSGGLPADLEKIKTYCFDWFFPFEWNCYSQFYTLKELEALVNIYVTIYESFQSEFEGALLRGLKEIQS